jgi:hypothetical protein
VCGSCIQLTVVMVNSYLGRYTHPRISEAMVKPDLISEFGILEYHTS